jgi:hypothetical protein
MYRKNTASQFVCFQLLLTATGAVATGLSPAVRRCIDGTFAAGGGTVTEDGSTGSYKYAMAQADTNGNDISLIFTATGAMPVCINFVTTAADPTDSVRLGLTSLPNAAASAIGGLPLSVDTSGRVDVLKINGTSQTARDIGASVLLSSGTGTGQLSFTSGILKVDVDTIKTNPVVNAGTVTFPTGATLASTTNITAGTITTVTTVTNQLTAAAIATGVWQDATAGDFTAANSIGKSIMNGVALGTGLTVNDIATKTGYSLAGGTQTFNMTGNITGNLSGSVGSVTGAVGSVTGAVGSVTGAVGSVTGNVGGNVVGSVASVTARVTANTDQLNGDATSAANVAKTTRAIGRGTVSGSPTTTSIPTSAFAPATSVADQLKGRIVTFDADTTTAALRGQSTDITASTSSATPTLTVTALTTAPAVGDSFSVT